ncbi:hypothetical protein [Chryseobacterium cucumeris]|uniref:hypothetical protein n=1 Tax=Chryseobacterium TaxID=59732 RepID=UPI00192E2D62|nr:hypothetical protein [Chryseobacterium cucumeris]QRA41306.1 hypothetical protein JNG87_11715 [Chryseobacterium cucumeris]
MFPFTYTFEREIKDSKTFKNVTDAVCHSITERGLTDIVLADGTIIGENKMFKLDFANKSPLVFSLAKNTSTTTKIQEFLPTKQKHFILSYFP